jgi:Na+-transporting methylmalonyl-CoA/oxaloacetate decarboxylase gamma subunit
MDIHFFGNLAAILLIIEAFAVFLVLLIALVYAIRGMRWLDVNIRVPLVIAQEKTAQVAAASKRAADAIAEPVIGGAAVSAGIRMAVRKSGSALKRRAK